MNAQNTENKPAIKRETKNKIRVEFDRTPLNESSFIHDYVCRINKLLEVDFPGVAQW